MKVLELFSGTHSIGKVCKKLNYEVVSLDRDLGDTHDDYVSDNHIKEDLLTWDYKQFDIGEFDIITASPVCLWWSNLRGSWVNRKCKSIHPTEVITREHIQEDIDRYGKPMVDKVFEIIEYFKPKYWWVENPQTGKMKHYIAEKYPQYNTYYDVDYCKYSDWGYQKRTRFWTNIKDFEPKICKKDCENIVVIKTQKGDVHSGYKTPIKSEERTLHKSNIGDSNKMKSIKKHEQKIHKERMGTSKTVMDNGKIIRCNTKALREKYKDYENIQNVKHKKLMNNVGGGNNRLERYRIPSKLIEDLLKKCE